MTEPLTLLEQQIIEVRYRPPEERVAEVCRLMVAKDGSGSPFTATQWKRIVASVHETLVGII